MGCTNEAQVFYPAVWHMFFPENTPATFLEDTMFFRSQWYDMELKDLIALLKLNPEEFKATILGQVVELSKRFPFWKHGCQRLISQTKLADYNTKHLRMRQHISLFVLKAIRKNYQIKTVSELYELLGQNFSPIRSFTMKTLETVACVCATLEGLSTIHQPQKDWDTFITFNKFLKKRGEFESSTFTFPVSPMRETPVLRRVAKKDPFPEVRKECVEPSNTKFFAAGLCSENPFLEPTIANNHVEPFPMKDVCPFFGKGKEESPKNFPVYKEARVKSFPPVYHY